MSRLCIVGCGLTGAITASLLKQKIPHTQIVILEKSRGTGGRFCTSKSSFGNSVDLGAQFVTKSQSLSYVQQKYYKELLKVGLLQPLFQTVEGLKSNDETENYFCPQGSGSIVKHFLKSSGCEVLFNHKVAQIDANGNKWIVVCENSTFEFDAVILTIPVPQILQIEGIISYIHGKQLENMRSVTYSSRFAFGLFYNCQMDYFNNISWVSKYIDNDSILRFCSIDHKKRCVPDLPSLAIHTTKEFGRIHVDEDSSTVQPTILSSLKRIFPNLPKAPLIKNHKWRYSQVTNSYVGQPGCLIISKKPLLICGGDGFSYSTFEGCIYSSEKITNFLIENYIY